MKRLLLLLTVLFSLRCVAADNYLAGARQAGMANTGLTLEDLWSSSHNQAGLAGLDHAVAGISFENRFTISELSVKSFAFALPVKNSGVFSIQGTQFGYSLYSEKKAGLAYARKLGGKISVGVQLDYLSTYIADDYGTRSTVAIEGGFLAEALPNLLIGVHVFNPTRSKLAEYGDERIPVLLRAGAGYLFSDKVRLNAEVEKDLDFSASFRAGIEYRPVDALYLRGGASTEPASWCFGFGLQLKSFRFDAAATWHTILGLTPQAGLTYDFKKP